MKTIGVRDLKAQLSRVLREVASGEAYLVTDRGRVVAELRQPDAGGRTLAPAERAMARLASSGHLRVAERPRAYYRRSPLHAPDGTAQRLIDEDRGE